MKKTFKNIGAYLFFFFFFLISLIIFLLAYGKRESFLLLNGLHTPMLDYFFRYFTNLGDGLFAVFFSIILFCFRRYRYLACLILLSYAFSGILAQIIKHIVDTPRPKIYFNDARLLHVVDGITLMGSNSFPSGHTTTAFALATMLAIFSERMSTQLLLLFLAIMVGYSRVYLSQHFPEDVLGGAITGTFTSLVLFAVVEKSSLKQKLG